MGTRDGDGAVKGRLRMGRMNFGAFLTPPSMSGVGVTPWGVNVSFPEPPLFGVEGVLRVRPADRGRRGMSSNVFMSPWVVDGRFVLATGPGVGRESVRVVAVDGRISFLKLLPLLWVTKLAAIEGRCLIAMEEESPDVEGRTIPPGACKDAVEPTTPALVVALRFLCSLV